MTLRLRLSAFQFSLFAVCLRVAIVAVCLGGLVMPAQTVSKVAGTVNFGTVAVTTGSQVETLTFTFATGGTVLAPVVVTQGVAGLDFTDAGTGSCTTNGAGYSYAAFASCTVVVKFVPTTPGVRMGAVELLNASGGLVSSQLIYGVGSGPLGVFLPGTLSTVAGSGGACGGGTGTICGDGGLATAATLLQPGGVAVDGAGNLYVADTNDHRIRKVTAAGIISTYAGTGSACSNATASSGACGDGGLATAATFYYPSGISLDGAGNLYVADYRDNRIRKITAATGMISTVAGTGSSCPNQTASSGACGDGGAATSGTMNSPQAVAVDGAGDVYFADVYDHRVRMVTASTGLISTVAGNGSTASVTCTGYTNAVGDGCAGGSAALNLPQGVAVDGAGNVYIGDSGDQRVREVAAATGLISTVAGNGTACTTSSSTGCGDGTTAANGTAELNNPTGVLVDAAGDLYIGDGTQRVREVAGGILSTVAGNGTQCGTKTSTCGDGTAAAGTGSLAEMNSPTQMALDGAGDIYLVDANDYRVRKVTASAFPLSFENTVVGEESAAQTVTLSNEGNAALIPAALTAGTDFTMASPALGCFTTVTSVAAGASCVVGVAFTPQSVGSFTELGSVTDNNLNVAGAQSVTLTGTSVTNSAVVLAYTNLPTGAEVGTVTPPVGSTIAAGSTAGVVTVVEKNGSTGVIDHMLTDPIQLVVQELIPITAYSYTGGVMTFTAANTLVAGNTVTLSGFGTSTFLNGQTLTVLAAGLSATQFEVTYSTTPVTTSATENGYGASNAGYKATYTTGSTTGYVTPTQVQGVTTFDLSTVPQLTQGATKAVYSYTVSDYSVVSVAPVTAYVNVVPAALMSGAGASARTMLVGSMASTQDSSANSLANCPDQNVASPPSSTNCTLADALYVSQKTSAYAGSTINFAYAGTPLTIYAGTSAAGATLAGNTIGYTVNIAGPGMNNLFISGASAAAPTTPAYRMIVAGATAETATVSISGLTLEYGLSTINGGALYVYGPTNITNVMFLGNSAPSSGGAIYRASPSPGALNITNSIFSGNHTTSATGGGAISDAAESGSSAPSPTPSLTVTNTSFLNNYSTGNGGAMVVIGPPTVTITGSLFSGNYNTTYSGGALAVGGTGQLAVENLTLTNDTFFGNHCGAYGGALYLNGTTTYTNSALFQYDTIVGNYATASNASGGGISSGQYNGFTMVNSVLAANYVAYASGYADIGYYTAPTHTFTGSIYTITTGTLSGGYYYSADSLTYLGISALGSYGGVTQTMIPLPGSRMLKYSTASPISTVTTDERGFPRPSTGSAGTVDIGAVQSNLALSFVNATPGTQTVGEAFYPQPVVLLSDSGYPVLSAASVTLGLTGGTLVGTGSGTTSTSTGEVAFSGLSSSAASAAASYTATAGTYTASQGPFVIESDTKIVFGTSPAATVAEGGNAGASVTVLVENSSSAVVTTDSNVITLLVTGPNGYAQTYTATAASGVATFNLSGVALTTAGTYTYTAMHPAGYTTTASETVTPGTVVTHLLVSEPSVTTAGFAESVTVSALDAGQNVVTSFTGTATFASSDALAVLPAAYTFVPSDNGVHTFTTTLNTAGLQTITATSSSPSDTGTQMSVTVQDSVWLLNTAGPVVAVSEQGSGLTLAVGTTETTTGVGGLAFDSTGGVWSVTSGTAALDYVSGNGTGTAAYSGGGLNAPVSVAVDGLGSIWVANSGNASVSEFTNGGAARSGSGGYAGSGCTVSPCSATAIGAGPSGVALDNSGGVWVVSATAGTVTHLVGAAAPVTVPLAGAVAGVTEGVEP